MESGSEKVFSMNERHIFKKLGTSEKRNILKSLISRRIEMIAKGESESIFYFTGKYMFEEKEEIQIEIELLMHSDQIEKSEIIIVNFNHLNDRYFFHTKVLKTNTDIKLQSIKDVFVLQRRKSLRLEIPEEYTGIINISSFKSRNVFYETRVLDFGSGGCRLLYNKAEPFFKSDETFRGFLKISHKKPFEIDCRVRHVFSKDDSVTLPQTFGVEFINLTSIDENRLLAIFMDLQRDLFIKFGNRI